MSNTVVCYMLLLGRVAGVIISMERYGAVAPRAGAAAVAGDADDADTIPLLHGDVSSAARRPRDRAAPWARGRPRGVLARGVGDAPDVRASDARARGHPPPIGRLEARRRRRAEARRRRTRPGCHPRRGLRREGGRRRRRGDGRGVRGRALRAARHRAQRRFSARARVRGGVGLGPARRGGHGAGRRPPAGGRRRSRTRRRREGRRARPNEGG